MEDVLPWPGNANMAFDLRRTEDVLLWPGNANMAFDLRPAEDVLPWPGRTSSVMKDYKSGNSLTILWQEPKGYAQEEGIDFEESFAPSMLALEACDKLVSWMSKKQDCTAMSSAEAEYVALSASCAQVMWMRTQLQDYGFNYNKIPLYCDSQSAIAISCNPVQHSRTKHIHTRYHFIKEQVENGIIELYFVRTEYQLADMFTKALPEDRFQYLVRRIGMRCLTPAELEIANAIISCKSGPKIVLQCLGYGDVGDIVFIARKIILTIEINFPTYIETRNNGEGLKKAYLMVPTANKCYLFPAVLASKVRPAFNNIPSIETVLNMIQRTKKHFQSEKEAIFFAFIWVNRLNVQDVKTNLLGNNGKFTSRDGESEGVVLPRYNKMMNDLTRNNLQVTTMQVNVQFLQQLQPRMGTSRVSEEYIEPKSEEDSDPEQAQRDKDMQKNLALLAKYFKKLYKPTNNNLRTYSNSKNKTKDTTPRYNNDNQSRQFGNQRTMTVVGTRETVGSQVVQQNGIQCFNCKGFSHYAKECRKPKCVKDYSYHKEKMMMCKQAEHGVPLQADLLEDTDEEIDEQELEAHYSFMAKIQEKDDSNVTPDSSNICNNDNQVDQNAAECVDERVALANLITNLTLDIEENKTILKQLKKANASLTQERGRLLVVGIVLNETLGLLARKDIDIKEGLKTKAYEISVVNQKHDELVKRSLLTKSQFEGQLKEKSKVISDLKVKEEKDIDKMIEMDKQLKFLNEIVYTRNQSIQTIHMLAPKCSTYNGRPTFANPRYLKKAQSEKPCLYEIPYDTSDLENRFGPTLYESHNDNSDHAKKDLPMIEETMDS
ncbi:ribonuclease H-like domain-containing protein [Tanacetum coccineum]